MDSKKTRATIYFDEQIYKLLKLKALESNTTISDMVNQAVYHELLDDKDDLAALRERAEEHEIPYEKMLQELKNDGKI